MKFFEFIKYQRNFNGKGDFNGEESSLSVDEQKEYLYEFAKVCKEYYKLSDVPKPVVEDGECKAYEKFLFPEENAVRRRLNLTNANAYSVYENDYEFLTLYTEFAKERDGEIILAYDKKYTSASCKIEIENKIEKAELEVCVSKDYNTDLRGGTESANTGKIIEFRKGIEELFRLQFYCDGRLDLKQEYPQKYVHINTKIGDYRFDEKNKIEVLFKDGKCFITLNGKDNLEVVLHDGKQPDTIMIAGGKYPTADWKIRPYIVDSSGKTVNVFEKSNKRTEENLGNVDIPYCLGTHFYKDKKLKLVKNFRYKKDERDVYIGITSLDPSGSVFLNGNFVAYSDDLMPIYENITKFLKDGENLLEVTVNPRAPENIITWHRHKDPYFGWFVGETFVESRANDYIEKFRIITEKTGKKISAICKSEIFSKEDKTAELKLFLSDGTENLSFSRKIKLNKGANRIEMPFSFSGKVWSVNSPSLYDVKLQISDGEKVIDAVCEKTGFRTIEQKKGEILLNGEKITLKGALLMQYLPPYERTVLNHVCPTSDEIIKQALIAKKMNCNVVRMHQLGYGTNDRRIARIFDVLGITVIWTTRMIDSVAGMIFNGRWEQKEYYQRQMTDVINSPSIIMWEGANEEFLYRKDIDVIYENFVNAVKEIDETRIICPVSHMYYANDSYDKKCEYYQDDGKKDEFFRSVKSSKGWKDKSVIRSAHTYDWLLGYGSSWKRLREQPWSAQPYLLKSKKHAYVISEYAIIGRQQPNTPGAKVFYNPNTYEYGDELSLGYDFGGENWILSQSYQALAGKYATKKMLSLGVDGMIWCALQSGANDGSYCKPPVDFAGYPKLSFYALKECFADNTVFGADTDVVWGKGYKLTPFVNCKKDDCYHDITVKIVDKDDTAVYVKVYKKVLFNKTGFLLESQEIDLEKDGYYKVEYYID